jgi:hypothetical protein
VEKAPEGIFKRATFLLPEAADEVETSRGFGPAEAGRVVERKTIGAHDIEVIELLDEEGFAAWLSKHLKGLDAEIRKAPAEVEQVLGNYIAEGYTWFLVDVVNLKAGRENLTEALRIEFATDHLYYPMRLTKTESGHTEVDLIVITPRLFGEEHMRGIPYGEVKLLGTTNQITQDRLVWLDPALASFGDAMATYFIRQWLIEGQINEFSEDVLVR